MFLIRNTTLKRLVTDGKRRPLNFKTFSEAKTWLRRNGNPYWLKIIPIEAKLNDQERQQLLKVNFQKVRYELERI